MLFSGRGPCSTLLKPAAATATNKDRDYRTAAARTRPICFQSNAGILAHGGAQVLLGAFCAREGSAMVHNRPRPRACSVLNRRGVVASSSARFSSIPRPCDDCSSALPIRRPPAPAVLRTPVVFCPPPSEACSDRRGAPYCPKRFRFHRIRRGAGFQACPACARRSARATWAASAPYRRSTPPGCDDERRRRVVIAIGAPPVGAPCIRQQQ